MKTNLKKYLAESMMIVFSVLFALFINKLYDDYKTEQKKEVALESIHKELVRNAAILGTWKRRHVIIRDRISDLLKGKNDSLRVELLKYNFLNLGILTDNQSLIDAVLTNTAWESAKSTGIVGEFNFDTAQQLTEVYDMQEVVTEHTVPKIVDFYFNADSPNKENLDRLMTQFQLRFWELTGQEEVLNGLYEKSLGRWRKNEENGDSASKF